MTLRRDLARSFEACHTGRRVPILGAMSETPGYQRLFGCVPGPPSTRVRIGAILRSVVAQESARLAAAEHHLPLFARDAASRLFQEALAEDFIHYFLRVLSK